MVHAEVYAPVAGHAGDISESQGWTADCYRCRVRTGRTVIVGYLESYRMRPRGAPRMSGLRASRVIVRAVVIQVPCVAGDGPVAIVRAGTVKRNVLPYIARIRAASVGGRWSVTRSSERLHTPI